MSWANDDGKKAWDFRDTVSLEVWESLEVGDPVEVITVPGEDGGHLRNGVYVDPNNFAFDIVLLAICVCVVVASAGRLLWWWFQGRKVLFWPTWLKLS